ncbi:hypothetical protein PCL_01283 [Purpureocillium lilacinum]|uniref:Uncharacterized protein n=1 Tax=Purpureocillium lilacinum TaxID=33203 RepID=A0A2U3E320_PURLI|nr:hypothetical protein Purlil1_6662 [Purpureocillium lilacinum]PWI68898.1 hypothetical protein PCL_01283 [Purpureocillium lilacinum]
MASKGGHSNRLRQVRRNAALFLIALETPRRWSGLACLPSPRDMALPRRRLRVCRDVCSPLGTEACVHGHGASVPPSPSSLLFSRVLGAPSRARADRGVPLHRGETCSKHGLEVAWLGRKDRRQPRSFAGRVEASELVLAKPTARAGGKPDPHHPCAKGFIWPLGQASARQIIPSLLTMLPWTPAAARQRRTRGRDHQSQRQRGNVVLCCTAGSLVLRAETIATAQASPGERNGRHARLRFMSGHGAVHPDGLPRQTATVNREAAKIRVPVVLAEVRRDLLGSLNPVDVTALRCRRSTSVYRAPLGGA